VVIIDISNKFAMERKTMKADSVMMHLDKNIIALRAKTEGSESSLIQVSYYPHYLGV
jgi:hypothetical protein